MIPAKELYEKSLQNKTSQHNLDNNKRIDTALTYIEKELQIQIPELKTTYLGMVEGQARITEDDELYKEYCLMKGLLHRLDHCSSHGLQ